MYYVNYVNQPLKAT